MISKLTAEDVLGLRAHIQDLLDKWVKEHRLHFRLKVSDEIIHQYDWTYYTVVPDKGRVRAYDYADALSATELRLRRDEGIEGVILVPSLEEESAGLHRATGKRAFSDKSGLSVPGVSPRRVTSARSRGRVLQSGKKEALRGHRRIKQASA